MRATPDANGNATAVAYPSGITVSQTFDETDRQSLITWSGGGSATLTTSMTWFPYGGLSSWASNGTHPVTMTVTEDTGGWITQVAASATPSPTSVSYAYGYDGNVKAIPSPASTPNELHDSLSRLISDRGRTRAYDDAGNVTTSNGFALSYPLATSDRWSSADAGAISYVFDSAGNATQRGSIGLLTGDDGTVIAIDNATWGRTAELRDHRNLRVQRAGAAGDETYLYSPAGELVQRTGATVSVACGGAGLAQTSTPVENYVYAGGRRIGMVRATITGPCGGGGGGNTLTAEGGYLYFADKMDLPHAIYLVSDGAQVWTASFDAFGVPLARNEDVDADGKSIHNDFELPGQFALSAIEGGPFVSSTGGGLVENWNRIYDSEVGRYLEVDPVGLDHASYRYVASDPFSFIDPTGSDLWDIVDGIHTGFGVTVPNPQDDRRCKGATAQNPCVKRFGVDPVSWTPSEWSTRCLWSPKRSPQHGGRGESSRLSFAKEPSGWSSRRASRSPRWLVISTSPIPACTSGSSARRLIEESGGLVFSRQRSATNSRGFERRIASSGSREKY